METDHGYEYNSVNQRTRKVVNNNETKYYYDQGRLSIEETNSYKRIYFYDNDGIAGFDYYKNGTITRYYLLRDATKLVIALLKEDGTIIEQYDYDPFGNFLDDLTNLSKINYILYKGYYFDFESGYYYCNSRYYNPKWCRWMSPDAIDYLNPEVLKGLNLYAYCENDPINKYDPTGHFGVLALLGITVASMLIGGTIQFVSNALAGKTGNELWRGFAGASLFIAAGASSLVQTGVDTLESVIRKEDIDWGQTGIDLGLNFVTTLVGNYFGGKIIPTNSGWFQTKKFLSVFTKPYAQKILLQTTI